jgi:hypothetical protein
VRVEEDLLQEASKGFAEELSECGALWPDTSKDVLERSARGDGLALDFALPEKLNMCGSPSDPA